METRLLYVIDIDGTVADNTHREHFLRERPENWKAFFEPDAIMADSPIQAAARHFDRGHFIHGRHMFLTARIDSTLDVSKRWLVQHGFATPETVVVCKPTFLRKLRAKHFKPAVLTSLRDDAHDSGILYDLVMVEDYAEVCASVAGAGFTVLQAPSCWDMEHPLLAAYDDVIDRAIAMEAQRGGSLSLSEPLMRLHELRRQRERIRASSARKLP